eukprot:CAMPEP_0114657604 /NCGR_PEP_ID=MMETSP0191-20121206/14211_1 /TAXON_ID=126664 /ORGANISM="Sorites sp." /LENGTH=501 /DNA_ID=CAMNT_0001877387 /DNA_START=1002 /DNA_END=2510 /DNA_ORIENTATION=+
MESYCTVKDTFDTINLGYEYDNLVTTVDEMEKMIMNSGPKHYVRFTKVDLSQFNNVCYELHIFVLNLNESKSWDEGTLMESPFFSDWCERPGYAGGSSVFGNGKMCRKCSEIKKPFNIYIDITKQLDAKDLDPENAFIRGIAIEASNPNMPAKRLQDIPGLPKPDIVGPLLNKGDRLIKNQKSNNMGAQTWLKRFGWYDGEIDGIFDLMGGAASEAISHFKKTYFNLGTNLDGLPGKAVRDFMLEKRCGNIDPHGLNLWRDELTFPLQSKSFRYMLFENIGANDGVGVITYCVTSLYKEIQNAFDEWSAILQDVTFKRVEIENKEVANILIGFTDQSDDNVLALDDVGGIAGKAGLIDDRVQINLDVTETWGLMDTVLTPIQRKLNRKLVKLYPVMRHMIGHVLGLDHSDSREDIMSPWYADWSASIDNNEKVRLKKIGWKVAGGEDVTIDPETVNIQTMEPVTAESVFPETGGTLPNDGLMSQAAAVDPELQSKEENTCC